MWPENVGIKALEVYFPAQYVDQQDLEQFDKVSAGKYTIGLGQSKMGFCNDREDIHSLCLTVLHNLMDKHKIKPEDVGRLEVGTETLLDKSKSVKSVLMQIFEPHGCTNIEGVDCTNACYGGTAALLNAVNWVESSSWDGRLALVVAADNAVYDIGSARPTGGAGAIAMIVGPNAILPLERGLRASCMKHAYDFYKPNFHSEYPTVDGQLSIKSYLSSLEECYQKYCEKLKSKEKLDTVSLNNFDAILFHSPFCKLIQKSFARLAFIDFLNTPKDKLSEKYSEAKQFHHLKLEDTYFNRDVEKTFTTLSKEDFLQKTKPSLLISNQVGNMYTPSIYAGLVSLLVSRSPNELCDTRIGLFSYGSGLCSTFFSLRVAPVESEELLELINSLSYVKPQLEARQKVMPEEYTHILALREKNWQLAPFEPQSDVSNMFPGTYYLVNVDEKYRRTYKRIPNII